MTLATMEQHSAAARACQGTWPTALNTDTQQSVYQFLRSAGTSLLRRCRATHEDHDVHARTHLIV